MKKTQKGTQNLFDQYFTIDDNTIAVVADWIKTAQAVCKKCKLSPTNPENINLVLTYLVTYQTQSSLFQTKMLNGDQGEEDGSEVTSELLDDDGEISI